MTCKHSRWIVKGVTAAVIVHFVFDAVVVVLLLLLALACDSMIPTSAPPPRRFTQNEINEVVLTHWLEAEYRIKYWFSWHPDCAQDYVLPTIRALTPTDDVATCTYTEGSREIKYREQFFNGCIAHELGHAALEQAGNGCWHVYEHDLADMPVAMQRGNPSRGVCSVPYGEFAHGSNVLTAAEECARWGDFTTAPNDLAQFVVLKCEDIYWTQRGSLIEHNWDCGEPTLNNIYRLAGCACANPPMGGEGERK